MTRSDRDEKDNADSDGVEGALKICKEKLMIRIGLGAAVGVACWLALCGPCLAQKFQVDCPATISSWRIMPSMRQYLNDYSCDCSNGNHSNPVCTKRGGSSSGSSQAPSRSSSSYGGGSKSAKSSLSQQMAQTLVTGLMQGLMNALLQPPAQSQNQQPSRDLEEEKRQAEVQRQVKEQIAVMEKDYRRQQEEAFGKNKKRLLGDLKMPGESGPAGGAMQQLYAANCSSYWELQAADAMIAGRDAEAETYRRNSAQARTGDLSNCSAAMAKLPDVPMPDTNDDFRDEIYAHLDTEIAARMTQIPEVKEKRQKAEAGVQEKEKQVEALQATIASPATEEEKKANDDLLQKALAELESSKQLLEEAQSQYAKIEKEIAALGEVHSAMIGNTKNKP
jgi:hypothetical protein